MRKIKDAIDLNTGEKVYFRGHAQSTYMSDGRTVEQAIKSGGGSGGGSYDDTEIQNKLTELSAEIDLIQPVIDTIASVSPNLFDVAFAGRALIVLSGNSVGKVYLDNNDSYAATPDAISVKENTLYSFFCNNPFSYDIGATAVFYDANEGYLSNVTYGCV